MVPEGCIMSQKAESSNLSNFKSATISTDFLHYPMNLMEQKESIFSISATLSCFLY